MNRAIELALKTWPPKNHPLHYELHHPLGKLVGEWGELLDDYMKHLYKPGYGKLAGIPFKPLRELIDVWYYIRILSYQTNNSLTIIHLNTDLKIDTLISRAIEVSSTSFSNLCAKMDIAFILPYLIKHNYSALHRICTLSNLTIDQLTEASWEKLKPGSERGEEWMKGGEYERK